MIKAGVDLHAALTLKDRITKAGFKNVTERIMKVPLGSWAKNPLLKKVGSYMPAVLYDGLQGMASEISISIVHTANFSQASVWVLSREVWAGQEIRSSSIYLVYEKT